MCEVNDVVNTGIETSKDAPRFTGDASKFGISIYLLKTTIK